MAACRSGEFAIAVEVSMGIAGSALAYRFYGRWLAKRVVELTTGLVIINNDRC
jgi:hypothetical protein